MRVVQTRLPGVLVVEPRVFRDDRGSFVESYSADRYSRMGIASVFVQDNVSQSQRGVLRGLHFQYPRSQAKLVTVVRGEVFDVAVDVRVGSPTFGAWTGEILSADNNHQLYVPGGFAHGFLVLSPDAVVVYKTSDYYDPDTEGVIRWNDPALGIRWPIEPTSLSDRDRNARTLSELANLPRV